MVKGNPEWGLGQNAYSRWGQQDREFKMHSAKKNEMYRLVDVLELRRDSLRQKING